MQVRVVILRFDPVLKAYDDSPLQELKSREVFTIRDHFLLRNGMCYRAAVFTCGRWPPLGRKSPVKLRGLLLATARKGLTIRA